jgi:N-methylhydantoinase B
VDEGETARQRDAIRRARGWRQTPTVQWHEPTPLARAAE